MKGLSEEVREIVKEYIGDNSVAGATVLAVQDGKEICDCQEGMADIENGRTMKRDTIFRLYSQTKPVTGAAAMLLMERGKLGSVSAGCRIPACIPPTENLAQRQMRSVFARRTGDAGCRSFEDDIGAALWRYDDGAGPDV